MAHHPKQPLAFRLGLAGAALPILVFAAGAAWLGFSGAPDERGLWPVLVVALGTGLLLAKRASDYSAAALRGMSRPIVMLMVAAWLLAGIFSAVLRESGLVHSLVWAGVGDGRRVAVGRHELLRTVTGDKRVREEDWGDHSCAGGQAHEVDSGRGSGGEQDA